jgi:hypothetical protein
MCAGVRCGCAGSVTLEKTKTKPIRSGGKVIKY